MFEFHNDRRRYFEMQILNTSKYVIPFIQEVFRITSGMKVLEIGAGEGGVLKSFTDIGCNGVAVELEAARVENAKKFMPEEIASGKIKFITSDIYNTTSEELGGPFDLIILKDVIEHIHDQAKLIKRMHHFIKPSGMIFFGFPPWYMPYGGHQQMALKKPSRIPWIHLLPMPLYKGALKTFKEDPSTVAMLAEIKETGISIERFERTVKETGWEVALKKHFLFNPIYEWKFNLKPRKQFGLITRIPFFRNFVTTCVYYLIKPVKD